MAEIKIVNMNQIVTDYLCSPEYRQLLSNHPQVRQETDLNKTVLNIKGAAFHLSKVLMNLLHNACEANLVDGLSRLPHKTGILTAPMTAMNGSRKGNTLSCALTIPESGSIRKIWQKSSNLSIRK